MKEEGKKKTVGEQALKAASEDIKADIHDYGQAMLKGNSQEDSYESNLIKCSEDGLKKYNSDFYVVVITKKEKLLKNVIRNYFLHRNSCPTPDWDQSVFRVNNKTQEIEYLWTIPDQETCLAFIHLPDYKRQELSKLSGFVHDFSEGNLDILARKLNGEIE